MFSHQARRKPHAAGMPRLLLHRIAALLLALAVDVGAAHPAAADARQQNRSVPNIVLILADDLGYGELGCYGQTKIETPHIDRLAREGMRFSQFYCGAPVCGPSRCVLMTGKHLGHAYVRDNWEQPSRTPGLFGGQLPLPAEEVTLAELLKARGYATGAFGKWGLGGTGTTGDPLKQGFDRFFGYNCQRHAHNFYPRYLVDDDKPRTLPGNDRKATGEQYAPQLISDELIKFIKRHKDGPFFVYYPTIIPHLALQAPEDDIAEYRGRWPETPYTGRSYLPHPTPRACYAAMITFMDEQVGRIRKTLDELGLAENTIILFTSDNGPTHLNPQVDVEFFNSAGGLRGLKGSVYEGGIRVPLVAWGPGRVPAETVSNHISAAYDLLPTCSDLAAAEAPANIDGISMAKELTGKPNDQQEHPFLLWEFHGYGGQQAVRMGDFKVLRTGLYRNPKAPFAVYNLKDDRAETTDIAADHPEVVKRAAEVLQQEATLRDLWDFAKPHPRQRAK
jgi:arylsulfatase A